MPGTKKYTVYAPPKSDNNILLNRLFKSDHPVLKSPTQDLVGDEDTVWKNTIKIAQETMQVKHQTGDMRMFPQGVDMTFGKAPKLSDVKWEKAGGPANPYIPDITSPGPKHTAGTDKAVDPKIATTDIKPNYVPAAPNTGTKSPQEISEKVAAGNKLGTEGKLGDSGANG